MSFGVQPDGWLSEVMSRPVFRVDGDGDDRALATCVRAPGFYFAKVATDRIADVHTLSSLGFRVVDTAVTFELVRDIPVATAIDVMDCTAADTERVLAIAGSAFRYSRFHLDPAVGLELAHRVKREWIANYVRKQRGDALLVARSEGVPVGFLAALDSAGTATIDLIAVASDAHGRGIGTALCAAFAIRYRGQPRIVGTQVANVPSIRMYTKLGYELARSQYVLHLHTGA